MRDEAAVYSAHACDRRRFSDPCSPPRFTSLPGARGVKGIAIYVRVAEAINEYVGRATAWLTLTMVLVAFAVVVMRYVFAIGWVWVQESYIWLHGIVFMAAAGYTLLHGGHVRVDIFYRTASERFRAWVDLLGSLLLLMPMLGVVAWYSWGFVLRSWKQMEGSAEAGGLPGLYLLKSMLIVFVVLLALQGLALAGRAVLVLAGCKSLLPRSEPTATPEPEPR